MAGGHTTSRALILAVVVALSPAVVRAGDVDLSADAVKLDGGKPSLEVRTRRALKSAVFILKRSDGAEVRMDVGALKAGARRRVFLEQPRGKFHWEGELQVHVAGEELPVSLPVTLDTVVGKPVALAAAEDALVPEENRITVTMNDVARAVKHTVYADDGKVLERGETTFDGVAEGAPLVVTWKNPGRKKLLRIDLVGESTAGVFTPVLQLVPWSLDIPHEDVLFPTGQHGNLVDVTLYVSGYTDTVGSMTSNQQLSERRARSIAQALRKLGVDSPISWGGYGEWKLATRTGDNVDEQANRRAVYTLSAVPPRPPPAGGWRPL